MSTAATNRSLTRRESSGMASLPGLFHIGAGWPRRVSFLSGPFFVAQSRAQPGPGIRPFAEGGGPRNAERIGGVFDAQACEQPDAGDFGRLRILQSQQAQGLIDSE